MKPQILTIESIEHYRNNKCIWDAKELSNTWHDIGQQFLLSIAFDTDNGYSVPDTYFVGLDNRDTISASDTISGLVNEPTTNGYTRQTLSSANGFAITTLSGLTKAVSGNISFIATTGSWGPVQNAFLTTTLGNTGVLIASVALGTSRTVLANDTLSIRFRLSFSGC